MRGAPLLGLILLAPTGCAGAQRAAVDPTPAAYRLVLQGVDGQPVALADYRGRVVLVNFFATWCFPCLGELPMLQDLERRRGPEGLQVVGIALDREGALVVGPFRDFYQIDYPLLLGGDQFAEPGRPFAPVRILPTTLLLARDGRILARWEGVAPQPLLEALVLRALRE